jgi:hypothetical protein
LGDGYLCNWRKGGGYKVGVVGEKEFIDKYAQKLSTCSGKKIRGFFYKSHNVWLVVVGNIELFFLFRELRHDMASLKALLSEGNYRENALALVEGFFDAEGCIKIIKEPVRITPKICPDLCNTDFSYVELVRQILKELLDIDAKYSNQKAYLSKDGFPRKTSYHLRIYKKESVRKFLDNIPTIKLTPEKKTYVDTWLNYKRTYQR